MYCHEGVLGGRDVSYLQEVGLPLGEDRDQEGQGSSHFTSECKRKHYNHQASLTRGCQWLCGHQHPGLQLFFWGRWAAPVKVNPVVNKQTKGVQTDLIDDSPAVIDRMIVNEYLSRLPEKQRNIVYGKFFESKSCAEISREMGCSRENVRQILERALANIKTMHEET